MLCDRILGNLGDVGRPDRLPAALRERLDPVDLAWHECGRRALRKTSRGGRALRILLPVGVVLRHGDILVDEPAAVVVANVVPTEVLVIRPAGPAEMGRVALEVGNLHAPACVTDDGELLVIPDGPVEAMLWELGVRHERAIRRFLPTTSEAMPTVRPAADFAVRVTAGSPGCAAAGPRPSAATAPGSRGVA